jgi:hypothetical protein
LGEALSCSVGRNAIPPHDKESPRLGVVCGGGKGGGGENARDGLVRYGVGFEAADRATRPQEGV